tara:strand:- start:359 stop:559 length:201 start_codon:yes stop_codon:yes gene_type:complete
MVIGLVVEVEVFINLELVLPAVLEEVVLDQMRQELDLMELQTLEVVAVLVVVVVQPKWVELVEKAS